MTSKLARERLEKIKSWRETYGAGSNVMLPAEEAEELACIALAAMDSESGCLPLDYLQGHKDGLEWAAKLVEANHPETGDWLYDDPIELAKAIRKGPDMPPVQPAQVVPVVPEEKSIPNTLNMYAVDAVAAIAEVKGWNACRAAMLQELKKSAGTEAICRSDENVQVLHTKSPAQSDCCPAQNCIHSAQGVDRPVAWHHTAKSKEENHSNCCFSYSPSHDFGPRYEKPQSQPHYLPERLDYDRALHFLSTEPRKVTPETVIGGNSPVIPDGWTCNDKANAALMMLDRIETADPVDDDRIDGIKRIVRELAAAPHDTPALNSVQSVVTVPGKWIPVSEQKPDCWCLTCRPVVLNDMRFVVCPDCGNKRCPRANDHRNACTGSNEPGQEGSAYPAAPQEVRGE